MGRVTRRNVCHGVAPRSIEASSRVESRPARRARTTNTAYEIENAAWAAITVPTPRASPTNPKNAAVAKPMIISGIMTGMKIRASAARLSLGRERTSASAAAVPIEVAAMVATKATTRLVRRDAISSLSWNATAYQRQVNPVHMVENRDELNERMMRTIMGV